jgi:tRNA modification GTPase
MDDVDTIAAVSTPAGTGGIGVVRVSGPLAEPIAAAIAGKHLTPRTAHYVDFLNHDGSLIDRGIGLFFPGPRSYTGEDVLELQGHGAPMALSLLLRRCLDLGARTAEPGEFTKRAFLNGKLDLAQAEAVADLIAAGSERAARSAVQSLTGEFSRRIGTLQAELTSLRVLIEGALDFPEEGIDFLAEADAPSRIDALLGAVREAIRRGTVGRLLRDGAVVALAGPPNAGKSTIINALCDEDVSIVTPIPGTTRDLVRERINIEGIAVQVVDTAGIREPRDPVEALGIARTREAVKTADLLLLIDDATDEMNALSLAAPMPAATPRVRVHNKIDLTTLPVRVDFSPHEPHIWMSAKQGWGVPELRSLIVRLLGGSDITDGAFSARERQLRVLQRAADCIAHARERLIDVELAAEELRDAQRSLSEITGELASDQLLGEIFERFCIGK